MEFVTTATETEALLLETNLIKRLKPRFNVLLRDDKSFPEILIRARPRRAADPQASRRAHTIKGDYFGPFASAWAVNRTLNTLQKAFLLRSCSDSVFESRTRPCMLHQIKRCSAPCAEPDQPGGLRRAGRRGRATSCAARAARCRSSSPTQMRRRPTTWSSSAPRGCATASGRWRRCRRPAGHQSRDRGRGRRLRRCTAEGGQACVQVFFFRAGQNWGNRAYFPRVDRRRATARGPRRLPRPVLRRQADPAADPAVARARRTRAAGRGLRLKAGRKVEIAKPQRGEKRELVDHALTNAREALGRKMAESSAQAQTAGRGVRGVRPGRAARADRGLRQQPHHGHQRGGRA